VDNRLVHYRVNLRTVPSVSGGAVPEAVLRRARRVTCRRDGIHLITAPALSG